MSDSKPLLVQEYLKTHTLAELSDEHFVNSSFKIPCQKFSLNYDQIDSKAGPLVNECRGVILARVDGSMVNSINEIVGETVLLARPMDRFFNQGDANAVVLDFEDKETRYFEKLDGTLCILYFDKFTGHWCVATRGVPEANTPIDGHGDITFRSLFEKALFETRKASEWMYADIASCFRDFVTVGMNPLQTYCFELTAPENRVVVDYKVPRVTLLAVRITATGEELHLSNIPGGVFWGVPCVKTYAINTLNDLVTFVNEQNPLEHEGVVACDANFHRVKVKNIAYVLAHGSISRAGASPRALLEIILLEKFDDLLPMLSDHIKERGYQMVDAMRVLSHEVAANYTECKAVADLATVNPRKEFCLHAQSKKMWLTPLIERFLGKNDSFVSYLKSHMNADGSFPDSLLENVLATDAFLKK